MMHPYKLSAVSAKCLAFMMLEPEYSWKTSQPLECRHNGCDSQPHDCLLNRLLRRRSKETSKLSVTGLCVGNSPGTGEFPAQMASNAESVSIWWRHHEYCCSCHDLVIISQGMGSLGLIRLLRGNILMRWRCKYCFMFLKINSTRQGLIYVFSIWVLI